MLYFDFCGKKLSRLGLGCMRFPTVPGSGEIDKEKTAEIIDHAIKNGINYFDTAWRYHGGQSETVVGELLSKYPRESFYLASKFPGYDPSDSGKVKEIFSKQLEKCRTPYFDFYLFHSVNDENISVYLDRSYGVYDYLKSEKEAGRIKHLGFSVHASLDTVKRFIDAYGDVIEFCQIQLNWYDYSAQNARAKVEYLNSANIPIWVMEPIRGGALCSLDVGYEARLRALAPDRTLPEWALRYIQSIDGIGVTLSGMSSLAQIKENIATFSESKPLSEEELKTLYEIAHDIESSGVLPCTACRYCTDYCPKGLDIPHIIKLYNRRDPLKKQGSIAKGEVLKLDEDKRPSACIACGACEKVCPQNIDIRGMMKNFAERNGL